MHNNYGIHLLVSLNVQIIEYHCNLKMLDHLQVSPHWVVEPTGDTALVGSTVVLDCSARGYPTPVITWMKTSGKRVRERESVSGL